MLYRLLFYICIVYNRNNGNDNKWFKGVSVSVVEKMWRYMNENQQGVKDMCDNCGGRFYHDMFIGNAGKMSNAG